eukprot:sb/3469365/
MAGLFSNNLHVPKNVDMKDRVADFWRTDAETDPIKHTLRPIVTGTSVLGVKCVDGVVIAADTLGSYGSLARFRDVQRLMKVNDSVLIGGFGDYADFQHIMKLLNQHSIDDAVIVSLSGSSLLLICIFYPSGEPYLGYVDKIGVSFEDKSVATGFGSYIAQPMMRRALEENPNMTCAQARVLMARCLKVLFYRDCRALNRFQIGTVTSDGCEISEPMSTDTDWSIGANPSGYE